MLKLKILKTLLMAPVLSSAFIPFALNIPNNINLSNENNSTIIVSNFQAYDIVGNTISILSNSNNDSVPNEYQNGTIKSYRYKFNIVKTSQGIDEEKAGSVEFLNDLPKADESKLLNLKIPSYIIYVDQSSGAEFRYNVVNIPQDAFHSSITEEFIQTDMPDCIFNSIDFSQANFLENIGVDAFCNQINFQEIDSSNLTSLKNISKYAFYNCRSLVTFDFKPCVNLEKIQEEAFYNCKKFKGDINGQIYIGPKVKEIGERAFTLSSFTSIDVSDQNINYMLLNGTSTMFGQGVEMVIEYNVDANFIWSKGGDASFVVGGLLYVDNSQSFLIPENIQYVPEFAFSNCSYLYNIKFLSNNDSLKEICSNAFSGCENLTSIVFTSTTPPSIIATNAILNCFNKMSITVPIDPNGNQEYVNEYEKAFSNCVKPISFQIYEGAIPSKNYNINQILAINEDVSSFNNFIYADTKLKVEDEYINLLQKQIANFLPSDFSNVMTNSFFIANTGNSAIDGKKIEINVENFIYLNEGFATEYNITSLSQVINFNSINFKRGFNQSLGTMDYTFNCQFIPNVQITGITNNAYNGSLKNLSKLTDVSSTTTSSKKESIIPSSIINNDYFINNNICYSDSQITDDNLFLISINLTKNEFLTLYNNNMAFLNLVPNNNNGTINIELEIVKNYYNDFNVPSAQVNNLYKISFTIDGLFRIPSDFNEIFSFTTSTGNYQNYYNINPNNTYTDSQVSVICDYLNNLKTEEIYKIYTFSNFQVQLKDKLDQQTFTYTMSILNFVNFSPAFQEYLFQTDANYKIDYFVNVNSGNFYYSPNDQKLTATFSSNIINKKIVFEIKDLN